MAYLGVKKRRGSRVKAGSRVKSGRVIQLPYLEVFLRKKKERFGGVSITSNPSFLIPPN